MILFKLLCTYCIKKNVQFQSRGSRPNRGQGSRRIMCGVSRGVWGTGIGTVAKGHFMSESKLTDNFARLLNGCCSKCFLFFLFEFISSPVEEYMLLFLGEPIHHCPENARTGAKEWWNLDSTSGMMT